MLLFEPVSSVFFLHMKLFITTLQIFSRGICLYARAIEFDYTILLAMS